MRRARRRYGTPAEHPLYRQIEHELAVIASLNFPGYFLVVADIVDFCKASDILCQGRGSAAGMAPATRRLPNQVRNDLATAPDNPMRTT